MSAEPLLVGIDVGTTTIKAIVFDRRGRIVSSASVPTPTHFPRPDWAYYEPDELWNSTVTALRQATAGVDDPRRIAGVAAASIGETAFPVDAHGACTYHAIAWFDTRTEPQVAHLDRTIGRDRLFAVSGLSLQPIFGLCKLLWLKENEPDAYARTAIWLNTADFIAYKLSGVPATDFSLASRTLALDLRELRWAAELVEEAGARSDLLAPLQWSGTRLGPVLPEVAAATGLPITAQVAVGGHDHVCAAMAMGVTETATVLNSLGTAEALFVRVAEPITDPELGRQGYALGVDVAGGYYLLGGLYTSGACIDWFRESWGQGSDYGPLIEAAAATPPGSLGVFFLPYLRLASPPYDDPLARGAFVGLTTDTQRGALFRAVLEGLAFEVHHYLEHLKRHVKAAKWRRIYATGGGTRNSLLMQIKAAVLNEPIHVVSIDEATALGAAVLGGIGAGIYANAASAVRELDYSVAPVTPDPALVEFYDRAYRRVYRQIYPTLRSLHHGIDALMNE